MLTTSSPRRMPARSGTARLQAIRDQASVVLDPPRPVVWNRRLVLDLVVETGEQYCGHCQESQQDGGKPGLKFSVHELGRLRGGAARHSSPLRYKQLHCHLPIPLTAAKSFMYIDFHNYRGDSEL